MNLFGGTIQSLEKSIDFANVKNQAISNNIANMDTPNYKSQNVVFKDVLNDSLSSSIATKRTNERHIDFGTDVHKPYKVVTNNKTMYNHNGNNVDVDKEMNELAKNQIYYQALVDRINGKFGSLKTVIKGGN